LVADITSICEAAEKEGNQLQVFSYSKTVPFCNFRQYYGKNIEHPSRGVPKARKWGGGINNFFENLKKKSSKIGGYLRI
jgi:hypothetical protein